MDEIPFDIEGKSSRPFTVDDVFNKGNTLSGHIFISPTTKYGMLYIEEVNGKKCPQTIWATPKMHYPFDKNSRFSFDKKINKIEAYIKYDGTNILAYPYKDVYGNVFVTYKTRKTAILRDGGYRNFGTMWRDILEMYPKIPDMVINEGYNLSFEMYGLRNKILIEYPEVSLDAVLLFGRDNNTGCIVPPSSLNTDKYSIKSVPLISTIEDMDNLITEYKNMVEYLNSKIEVHEQRKDDEVVSHIIYGLEGSMWYGLTEDGAIQLKCKPDVVRDIHFKAGEGVPKHSIFITIMNAFEDRDDPDVEYIIELLKEEFEESDILRKIDRISKMLSEIKTELKLKKEIVEEYNRHKNFDINKDKGTVMRHFSELYPRDMMKRIYSLLLQEFGKK